MDPIPTVISTLLNAIQASASQAPSAPALPILLALAGQDVSMVFLGQTPDGQVNLALPSGQVVTARGQMPFPEGTQLLVRILTGVGDAPVRLQTLQAVPPAPPAILAPLYQGEAGGLQASLAQPEPPPGLAPLVELFQLLGGAPAPSRPDAGQLQAALETLPAPVLAAWKTVLEVPQGGSPATLAEALEAWLASVPAEASAVPTPTATRPPVPVQVPVQAPVQDLLQRLQTALDHHPELAPEQGNALLAWLKRALTPEPAAGGPARILQAQLEGRPGPPAAAPETWEAWIRGSVKALNDPQVAPQGAPFHAAQAKEGTAFYEIPLPWAPQHPLQVWVESERGRRGSPGPEEGQRVLLGLRFSNLGETRVGLAKGAGTLQVRVWAEHPERLEAARAEVEDELKGLGGPVDLKILPLVPGPGGAIPSLRSQLAGSSLEVLG